MIRLLVLLLFSCSQLSGRVINKNGPYQPNPSDSASMSPIHKAAWEGNLEDLKRLIN